MKAVLQSIRPEWCVMIARKEKTIEVRKTKPRCRPPFRVYIYCTKSGPQIITKPCQVMGNGKVIGEYVCDGIQDITYYDDGEHQHYQWIDAPAWAFFLNQKACLNDEELKEYLGTNGGYGWHISDLKIYDMPLNLKDLHKDCSVCGYVGARNGNCDFIIKRPPQSWCYVEGLPSAPAPELAFMREQTGVADL